MLVKWLEAWDRAVAVSRATLRRKIPPLLRSLVAAAGTDPGGGEPLSRATLEPE